MSVNKTVGATLAIAAAGLFTLGAAGVVAAPSATEQVHCYGVNQCKGHNDCKTAENACAGHAVCKGHGFVVMSEKACGDIGGDVGE